MATKPVRFITETGTQPVHVFRNIDGSEVDVPCSQRDYDNLASGASPTPPQPGMVWLYSAVRVLFNVGTPAKDDCVLLPGGCAAVFTGGDPYRGDLVLLPREEYNPTRSGNNLITDRTVPETPGTADVVVGP